MQTPTSNMLPPQEITTDVLLEKYAKGTETNEDQIFKRVAKHLSSVEKSEELQLATEKLFYATMKAGGVGAGRIMSASGTDVKATLLNCYVVAVGDSIDGVDEEGVPGIYEALRQAACTMQKGGGVGYNFSKIRPKGSWVKSVQSTASGPCSYIDIFDASCSTIESAGCFAGDTLINTTEGLVPVKTIVESTKDYTAITHLGPKPITAKFRNGVKPVWKVTTDTGYSVTVTPDHKFAVFDQGKITTKAIKDLDGTNTDLLLSVPISSFDAKVFTTNDKVQYVTGVIDAVGEADFFNEHILFRVHLDRRGLLNNVSELLSDVANDLSKFWEVGDSQLGYTDIECHKNKIMMVVKNQKVVNAFIPTEDKHQNRASLIPYLAGVIDFLGSRERDNGGHEVIQITLANEGLANSVHTKLISVGVVSSKTKLAKSCYLITIRGKFAISAYQRVFSGWIYNQSLRLTHTEKEHFHHDHVLTKYELPGWMVSEYCLGLQENTLSVGGYPDLTTMSFIMENSDNPELMNTVPTKYKIDKDLPDEETYDLEVEEVHLLSGNGFYTSNSRRGAQLGALNIDHPDILEFVQAKRTKGRWNNFNVSVVVTDEFMRLKNEGLPFQLVHPARPSQRQIEEGAHYREADSMWIYKTINAKELWDAIMRSNYEYAEPGILFFDNINNDNNLKALEILETTNPCVTGDTLVLTNKGQVRIDSLVGKETTAWNGYQWSTVTPKVTGTDQPILDMVFSDGSTLSCTPYHKFVIEGGLRVEAVNLSISQNLARFNLPYPDTIDLDDHWFPWSDTVPPQECGILPKLEWLATKLKLECVEYSGSGITFYNDDKEFLSGLRYLFINLGCFCTLNEDSVVVSGGYILQLCSFAKRHFNIDLVTDNQRKVALVNTRDKPPVYLVSKTLREGVEPKVYCFSEPMMRTGVFNGIMTGNCGEVPLPPNGCCDLGAIVLPRLVKNPFTPSASFDFDMLRGLVSGMVRMLDNVLDASIWPLPEQQKEAMSKRRIGVGFTGLANAIAMCNKTYYEEDGLGMARTICETMKEVAYETSALLAKEKGPFPLFDVDTFLDEGSPPTKDQPERKGTAASRLPELTKDLIRKYGIRNSHLLSIAPTGTISLAFADNASNGIEPPFSLAYSRKKRVGDGHVQYNVLDHSFRVWLSTLDDKAYADAVMNAVCSYQDSFEYNGVKLTTAHVLPKSLVTALSMTPAQHLSMMAVVQPYICQSISKTVNVPKECDFEEFKHIYDQAWKFGLKGVSTYRPNDILGAVLSIPTTVQTPPPTKEPMTTIIATLDDLYSKPYESREDGMLQGVSVKGRFFTEQGEQKFIVTINFLDTTATTEDLGVVTISRPVEFLLTSNFTTSSSVWQAAMRFMSLMARSGVPVPKIIENMREVTWEHGKVRYGYMIKDGKKIPLWHNSDVAAVGYVIQQTLIQSGHLNQDGGVLRSYVATLSEDMVFGSPHIPDPKPTQPLTTSGKACPECNANTLVKRDGCESCTNCGYVGSCG